MNSASSKLVRDSALLIVTAQVGNIANLLFQVFMMHRLKTEEYGALAAMLGVVLALSLPMDALRSWVAHVAAQLAKNECFAELGRWLFSAVKRVALLSMVIVGLFFLARQRMAGWFGVERGSLIGLTGWILAGTMMSPLLTGALQGIQAFGALSVISQAQALLRLVFGIVCVLGIRASAEMALMGQTMAVGFSLVIGMFWLRILLARSPVREASGPVALAGWGYAIQSLVVLTAVGILMNADVIFAKMYLDPLVAGHFARAATLARAVIFLPAPIALVLFPKVASSGTVRADDQNLLRHAVGLGALLIGTAAGSAALAMPWIYPLLTGIVPDAETLHLTRSLLLAMSPVGMVILLLNFEMAQHRFATCYLSVLWAAGYIGTVALWHRNPGDITLALAGFGFLSLFSLGFGLRHHLWKKSVNR